ncbi:SDR family oxidoreductase [Pseudomonas sp. KK4]|uniref:UDP-glucose 4-epimerase family protein n=1 Tax=Pseudomonas sp. KK4 TaxID=1855729 RepID=UPI00097C3F7C|nr:SDR family oxidoreductase [Pseudomonas sp. KK4]
MSKKILVTGATGFLGHALLQRICAMPDSKVVAPIRNIKCNFPGSVETLHIGNIDHATDWSTALDGVDTVVHAAARVHVMHENAESIEKFRAVNVKGTLRLANQAVEAGVKRFIFISSIKVNGECTPPGKPFHADDNPLPLDAYGVSKYEAEQQLLSMADQGLIEVVIIRPVLIYGPGVGANFQQMMRWLSTGIPLPFGGVDNKRSLVSLDNVVDLVVTCIDHPRAANQIFLVSDGEDVSTTQLMNCLVTYLGANTWLFPISTKILILFAQLTGRRSVAQRLFSSLQVDIKKNEELLGWRPPVRLADGLKSTATFFLRSRKQ